MDQTRTPKIRRDGWTAERQLCFLDTLSRTRSARAAAQAAGMSRESAYRLRDRRDGALFAALWDRALACEPPASEGHTGVLGDGRLLRLLGTHYRRERGDFSAIGAKRADLAEGDRTQPL
jgi:hypothetical protein